MNSDFQYRHRLPSDKDGGGEGSPLESVAVHTRFPAEKIADAFGVEIDRVHNALAGEFALGPDGTVDSRQAQALAEVLIGDRPQAGQQEALMKLGAFTPQSDADEASVFERPAGELSDRLRPSEQQPNVSAPREADQ